jgi:plastocyanin
MNLIIKSIVIAGIIIALGLIVVVRYNYQTAVSALRLAGELFFENGTGLAYFDDGTTRHFNHSVRPENGYYYDNSTIFYAGNILGISNSTDTAFSGNTVNVSIVPGSSLLANKSKAFEPNPVKIRVGDMVTWTNHDWRLHNVISPPIGSTGQVAQGMSFDSHAILPGNTFGYIFTKPGGFHYNDEFDQAMVGTVIVEAGGNATAWTRGANTCNNLRLPSCLPNASNTTVLSIIKGVSFIVSIVPGSSSLTETAFGENPLQVKVGAKVAWVNEDSESHAVTSGRNGQPDGKFDSGIMDSHDTFSFTFTQPGRYPYFCMLHPNMVGTVISSQ